MLAPSVGMIGSMYCFPKLTSGSSPANFRRPLAYAATISNDQGVYVLGGETYSQARQNHATDSVLLLSWNKQTQQVDVREDALPALPKPCRYHAAAELNGVMFVAASHAATDKSQRLDEKSFWQIDLADDQARWTDLESWPGRAREKMTLVVQKAGADERLAAPECIYMFSGATWYRDASGTMDLAGFEHFADNYRYEPHARRWTRIADLPAVVESRDLAELDAFEWQQTRNSWVGLDGNEPAEGRDAVLAQWDALPRPAAAATGIAAGQSHVLLFSGATGRYVTLGPEQHPRFPKQVLAYHTITDTWQVAGEMPLAVVTTTAVRWNDQIVIPSGEIKPGVRTQRVQSLRLDAAQNRFGWINMAVVIAYLVLLVGIGYFFSRQDTGTAGFFLAGRNIPWWGCRAEHLRDAAQRHYLCIPAGDGLLHELDGVSRFGYHFPVRPSCRFFLSAIFCPPELNNCLRISRAAIQYPGAVVWQRVFHFVSAGADGNRSLFACTCSGIRYGDQYYRLYLDDGCTGNWLYGGRGNAGGDLDGCCSGDCIVGRHVVGRSLDHCGRWWLG